MTWRAAIKLVVCGLRRRAGQCDKNSGRVAQEWSLAYRIVADDLEYIATCAPYEALAKLREFGREG